MGNFPPGLEWTTTNYNILREHEYSAPQPHLNKIVFGLELSLKRAIHWSNNLLCPDCGKTLGAVCVFSSHAMASYTFSGLMDQPLPASLY